MAADGASCSFSFNDLKKHYERHDASGRKAWLSTPIHCALLGQNTDRDALAEQSSCRPAATDDTAQQTQHRTQQTATATASPHNYSMALPSTRNDSESVTDHATNGNQDSNADQNTALDASSDSWDFPDEETPRGIYIAMRTSCLNGSRLVLVPKAAGPQPV